MNAETKPMPDRLGRQLLAALLRHEEVALGNAVTLHERWQRYSKESPAFLDNTPRTRREDKAHVQVLMDYFGESADVGNFTEAGVTTGGNPRWLRTSASGRTVMRHRLARHESLFSTRASG
jgi:hypothetical protein